MIIYYPPLWIAYLLQYYMFPESLLFGKLATRLAYEKAQFCSL